MGSFMGAAFLSSSVSVPVLIPTKYRSSPDCGGWAIHAGFKGEDDSRSIRAGGEHAICKVVLNMSNILILRIALVSKPNMVIVLSAYKLFHIKFPVPEVFSSRPSVFHSYS